jgi:hypothetical protein
MFESQGGSSVSREAVQWVLESAPNLPSHLAMTLMGLAWHADENGRNAYPAQATLAGYDRKSERAVRKEVRELARLGLIRPGDPRSVAHIPADRRPNVWDLAVDRVATGGTTVPVAGGPVVPVAGGTTVPGGTPVPGGTTVPPVCQIDPSESPDTGSISDGTTGPTVPGGTGVPGGTVDPPNQLQNLTTEDFFKNTPETKPPKTNHATVTPISDEDFERFWKVYPRKISKGTARKAWIAALKRGVPVDRIVTAAERYRDHHAASRTEAKFIRHASTWLNGESYDDETEPVTSQKPAVNGHQPFRNPTDMSVYMEDL